MISLILAGGLGTRISNETATKPKPLITLNNKPIISYIISHYRKHNVNEFIIAGGYKYKKIIRYFGSIKNKDIFFDKNHSIKIDEKIYKNFKDCKSKKKYFVKVVNTGLKTETGGRIFKLKKLFENYDYFFLTYGDGLSDINLNKTYSLFKKNKYLVQVTAVKSPPRFGEIKFDKNTHTVKNFSEKPSNDASWINGGFFILRNKMLKYLNKNENFEKVSLPRIVKKRKLSYYKHNGYWQCMDTPRDKIKLEKDIKSGKIKL
ncbi:sugar phosphate nucleotidyltransferase [Candidatus Pelagibacter ubique]|nr:sugar phosphate nucleotidyltransferase [Candidatus Pelagibacter ubique]